jgi:hypothetical protein
MSDTTRYSPAADPGVAVVILVPNCTEHPEPGGVNCTLGTVVEREVGVEPPPETRVERLRSVHVRDGDDDHLELHVGPADPGCLCDLVGAE